MSHSSNLCWFLGKMLQTRVSGIHKAGNMLHYVLDMGVFRYQGCTQTDNKIFQAIVSTMEKVKQGNVEDSDLQLQKWGLCWYVISGAGKEPLEKVTLWIPASWTRRQIYWLLGTVTWRITNKYKVSGWSLACWRHRRKAMWLERNKWKKRWEKLMPNKWFPSLLEGTVHWQGKQTAPVCVHVHNLVAARC